jgi:2'-5' RNA ligase
VSPAASVGSGERIRLFCALRLPGDTIEALVAWQGEAFAGVRDIRVLSPTHLHVTLAFLGHRPVEELDGIAAALRQAATNAVRPVLSVERYRETRSVGMLALRDDEGRAQALAGDLHARLERLGVYEPEQRKWLPHVTVLRFRSRPRLSPELPAVPSFSPSDAALYHSVLRSGGAQYEVVESVALGG